MQWPSISIFLVVACTVVHVFEEYMSTKGFQILIARLKLHQSKWSILETDVCKIDCISCQ